MNHQKDLQQMIKRYVSGTASEDEKRFIEAYYQHFDNEKAIHDHLSATEMNELEDESFKQLKQAMAHPPIIRKPIKWYRYAAVLVIALGAAILYKTGYKPVADKQTQLTHASTAMDVLPGTDKAILTLADGSKVVLDNHGDQHILQNDLLTITKTKDGQLIYAAQKTPAEAANTRFNTVETPRGGQFRINLPDGTRVWLNAASSLTYPEQFTGAIRQVSLQGEAYFEVAKDKKHPFRVRTENESGVAHNVEVLGTHFNVNAYTEERAIKTTLVEGSVKVSVGEMSRLLSQGNQSVFQNRQFTVKEVETPDETAWKDGLFRFNNLDLTSIIFQLERWYDIQVDEADIPKKRYNGMVPRSANLSEVLRMLEKTGSIKFEIMTGKRLKVIDR